MPIEKTLIPTRRSRATYIAQRFKKYLCGDILEIGHDEAHLKMLLPEHAYTTFDIEESHLKNLEALPFDDRNFDCVLCSDLLEHVDNLPRMFHELLRVSRRYVLISFPNNLKDTHLPIAGGEGSFVSYGEAIKPIAELRKSTFNVCDIVHFMESHAENTPFRIREMFATDKPRAILSQMIKKMSSTPGEQSNRYKNTLWTVIEIFP